MRPLPRVENNFEHGATVMREENRLAFPPIRFVLLLTFWSASEIKADDKHEEAKVYAGYDLRLMSSVKNARDLPRRGQSLIIVAAVDHMLHFRIFDGDRQKVLDMDERRLRDQAQPIEHLRKQLVSLWPPHELTGIEKGQVIAAVKSIVDGSINAQILKWVYGYTGPITPEMRVSWYGFDLRLMSSVKDMGGLSTAGESLIIVAEVKGLLHFRIFNRDGKMVVDEDETKLGKLKGRMIRDLGTQLQSLWPPHVLMEDEVAEVIARVKAIVDYAPPRRRVRIDDDAPDEIIPSPPSKRELDQDSRAEAARALRDLYPEQTIYHSGRDKEGYDNIPRLGQRAKGVISKLTTALQSPHPDIRARAIEVIGLIGVAADEPETRRLLQLALQGRDETVSRQAARTLLLITSLESMDLAQEWLSKAESTLRQALEARDGKTRIWAAGALRECARRAPEQSLLSALRSADKGDKIVFAYTLMKMIPDAAGRIQDVRQVIMEFKESRKKDITSQPSAASEPEPKLDPQDLNKLSERDQYVALALEASRRALEERKGLPVTGPAAGKSRSQPSAASKLQSEQDDERLIRLHVEYIESKCNLRGP